MTLYALWKINSYTVTFDKNYLENNLCNNPTPFLSSSGATINDGILNRDTIDCDEAIAGKAIEITFDGSKNDGGVWNSFGSYTLEQGQSYTWSVYLKCSRNLRLKVGNERYGSKFVDVTTEWQRFDYTFEVTGNVQSNNAFIFYTGFGTGNTWNSGDKLYIHSVQIAKTSSPNTTSVKKQYNATVGTLSTPTREGYTFDGWYTAPSGGTKISSSTTVPAGDVTYYAHWKNIPLSTNYGKIDIVWLNTNNQVITTPNAPNLYNNSLKPVTWTKNGTTYSEDATAKSTWYNYSAASGTNDTKQSMWANAKNSDGSYFVWIPRFAYRITYYESENSTTPTGYWDGKGLQKADKNVQYPLDEGIETVTANGESYIVHPAFMKDDDKTGLENYARGGWDSDLSGFWIAKYEMSRENSSDGGTTWTPNGFANYSGGNYAVTEEKKNYVRVVSKPGVTSWRYNTISNMYINCYNYDRSKESHMMKNSEWGAVTYLTHSKYGRNGNRLDVNNSSEYLTGNGGGSPNASAAEGITNAYDTEVGARASTTGNIYGVYDMAGGAWEYTATWNALAPEDKFYSDNASFASKNGTSTKYATAYRNNIDSESMHGEALWGITKIGDAKKEVTYLTWATSWFGNWSWNIGLNSKIHIVRGGYSSGRK